MEFKMDDRKILKIYKQSPEIAIDLLNDKYKDLIEIYDKLSNFAGVKKEPIIVELLEKHNSFSDKYDNAISIGNDNPDFVGKEISLAIDLIVWSFYEATPREISFDDYKDYLFMILGQSDNDLYQKKQERFSYLVKPLLDEPSQVYDSLNVLESYLFDLEADGAYISFEQKKTINTTISEVRECMESGDIELAKLKIVALQMLMGLDVRFYPTLKEIITSNVNLKDYVSYVDEKGKGRIR